MKRLLHITLSIALAGLLLTPSDGILAQDRSTEDTRTVIEVKNGKVYLNGEEVAELEDSESPVLFKRSGNGEVENVWVVGDEFHKARETFGLRSNMDRNGFRISTAPRAFGFMSRDGGQVEFFEKDAIEAEERMHRRYAEVMADNLAERAIEIESMAPGFAFYSSSGSLGEEGRAAERRSREIARMLRRGEGDSEALEAELDDVLGVVFDEKQAAQQERIDEMRQKLAELEERLEQRRTDRAEIIGKRKNELLGRSSRYDW